MSVVERSLSQLLRRPKEVIRALADSDVLLRRRGAPALWLSRADREEERTETLSMLARTLRNIAAHRPEALEEALPEIVPWIQFLPPADRRTLVEEFAHLVVASADLDNFAPLAQFLHEWRATAEIYADPKLARRLLRSLRSTSDAATVPRR